MPVLSMIAYQVPLTTPEIVNCTVCPVLIVVEGLTDNIDGVAGEVQEIVTDVMQSVFSAAPVVCVVAVKVPPG